MDDCHRHCWLVLTLALSAGACRSETSFRGIEKPPAPEFQLLLDAYAAPTGVLSAEVIAALSLATTQRIASVDALAIDRRVVEAARAGLMQLELPATALPGVTQAPLTVAAQVTTPTLALRGDGYLVVTRICDGWGPSPVPDLANGFMELTVGFTEQGLDPVIWGRVSACRYTATGRQLQLDGIEADLRLGDVRVYIGRNATLANFGTFPEPVLVDIAAQVLLDGVELTGRFNFRVDLLTRALEILVPLATGHVIVAVPAERTSALLVRAANGIFSCDLTARSCVTASGEPLGTL